MALLIESREIVFGVIALIGCVFFFVDWILQQPSVWKFVSKPFFQLAGDNDNHQSLKENKEFQSAMRFRLVCAVHNTPQSILSVWALLDRELWEDSLHGTTPLSQFVVMVSCGFFVYDIYASIKLRRKEGIVPILHGSVCFSDLLYTLLASKFFFYGPAAIVWEISTPFVHLRWFLSKMDMRRSRLFFNNGMLMLLSFGLCRICWGTYVAFKFFRMMAAASNDSMNASAFGMPMALCLSGNLLNYYWFYKMIAIARRYLSSLHSNGAIHKKTN